jgi:hypothetical protein
VLTLEAMSVLM